MVPVYLGSILPVKVIMVFLYPFYTHTNNLSLYLNSNLCLTNSVAHETTNVTSGHTVTQCAESQQQQQQTILMLLHMIKTMTRERKGLGRWCSHLLAHRYVLIGSAWS